MKGIFVIIDGMADLPVKLFSGKTPLEAATMPNLDFLAARGKTGFMYSVKPGFVPESDEAIISIFGNNLTDSTRGQLEAIGSGLDLTRGDLALRVNFATVDSLKDLNIIDRRAGRTLSSAEAKEFEKALNKIELPFDFEFKPTIQHRGVLVIRGGFSDNISGNDFTYHKGKSQETSKTGFCKPLDDEDNSQYTANVVNEFLEKAYEILSKHPVNEKRKRKGLLPANYLLVRGSGIETPKLKKYSNWHSVSYMPLEIGFAKTSGMSFSSFAYPKLKGLDVYENLHDGLKKACKHSIKEIKKVNKTKDYVYVHIKETDIPGHDNKPLEKKDMLEYLDKTLFNFLRKFAPPNNLKVLVTADHATPCKLKNHSSDFVPVLYYNGVNQISPERTHFCEDTARKGSLGRIQTGKNLFKKVNFGK